MRAALLAPLALLAACASTDRAVVPGDARVERAAHALHLASALAQHPLPASGRRKDVLHVDGDRSTHLVQLARALPLHVHPERTEYAHVLRGRGSMTLGDRTLDVAPGLTVRIDPGVAHGVVPADGEVLVAVVQVAPPLPEGDDAVFVPAGGP